MWQIPSIPTISVSHWIIHNKVVLYQIQVHIQEHSWSVWHRYSAFHSLHKAMSDISSIEPLPFPKKRMRLGSKRFEPAFLDERAAQLQSWCCALLDQLGAAIPAKLDDFLQLTEHRTWYGLQLLSQSLADWLPDVAAEVIAAAGAAQAVIHASGGNTPAGSATDGISEGGSAASPLLARRSLEETWSESESDRESFSDHGAGGAGSSGAAHAAYSTPPRRLSIQPHRSDTVSSRGVWGPVLAHVKRAVVLLESKLDDMAARTTTHSTVQAALQAQLAELTREAHAAQTNLKKAQTARDSQLAAEEDEQSRLSKQLNILRRELEQVEAMHAAASQAATRHQTGHAVASRRVRQIHSGVIAAVRAGLGEPGPASTEVDCVALAESVASRPDIASPLPTPTAASVTTPSAASPLPTAAAAPPQPPTPSPEAMNDADTAAVQRIASMLAAGKAVPLSMTEAGLDAALTAAASLAHQASHCSGVLQHAVHASADTPRTTADRAVGAPSFFPARSAWAEPVQSASAQVQQAVKDLARPCEESMCSGPSALALALLRDCATDCATWAREAATLTSNVQ